MKHFKYILLMVFAFALTGCATGPKIDYAGISSKIQSGERGGVIGGFESTGLSYANVALENVDDKSRSYMVFSRSPRVYNLAPGTYKIKSGKVGGHNVTGNMPLIGIWAENFEVKAGEVTSLGNLQMNRITNNVKTGGGWKVINALSSFGTNLNDDITHVSFNVSPMSDADKATAVEKYAGLQSRVVSRPLELRFTEAEFGQMITEVSAKDADGKLPSKNEIQSKLRLSLLSMMFKSILEESADRNSETTP